MRRLSLLFAVFWAFALTPATAALSLNPFEWFDDPEAENLPLINERMREEARAELADARATYENGNGWWARRKLNSLIKDYPNTPAAAEALVLRAQIYLENERWKKAFEDYQRVIREHPQYPNFNQILGNQFFIASNLMEGARGKIFGIIPGFRQYSEATRQFEQIVGNAPYSDYAPLALMNIALLGQREGDEAEAIDALDRLINFYPQSMLASDAYYNLADTYASLVQGFEYDQGSTRQAISYYEDFLILFPEDENVGEVEANIERMENLLANSRKSLGDFYYFYRNNNTAALVFYNEAITIAPDSEAAAESRALIEDIEAGVRPTTGSGVLSRLLTGQ